MPPSSIGRTSSSNSRPKAPDGGTATVRTTVRCPAALTRGTSGIENLPQAFVSVPRSVPRRRTVALGSGLPVPFSTTRPATVPCPRAGIGLATSRTLAARVRIEFSHPGRDDSPVLPPVRRSHLFSIRPLHWWLAPTRRDQVWFALSCRGCPVHVPRCGTGAHMRPSVGLAPGSPRPRKGFGAG